MKFRQPPTTIDVSYWYGLELISPQSNQLDKTLIRTYFLEKNSMIIPVNTLWDEFKDVCQRCLDLIPTRLIATSCKQPWIFLYIRWLSHRKQHMYNSARSSQSPFYWQKYQLLKKEIQKNVVRLPQIM